MKPSEETKRWRALIDRAHLLLTVGTPTPDDVAHASVCIQAATEIRVAESVRQRAQKDGKR